MWCNISCTTMNRLIFHPWKYGPYCSCSMQDVWSLSSWISTGPGDGTAQPEVLRGGNNSSYGRILGWETLALAARRGDRRKEGERKGRSQNPICRSNPATLVLLRSWPQDTEKKFKNGPRQGKLRTVPCLRKWKISEKSLELTNNGLLG